MTDHSDHSAACLRPPPPTANLQPRPPPPPSSLLLVAASRLAVCFGTPEARRPRCCQLPYSAIYLARGPSARRLPARLNIPLHTLVHLRCVYCPLPIVPNHQPSLEVQLPAGRSSLIRIASFGQESVHLLLFCAGPGLPIACLLRWGLARPLSPCSPAADQTADRRTQTADCSGTSTTATCELALSQLCRSSAASPSRRLDGDRPVR